MFLLLRDRVFGARFVVFAQKFIGEAAKMMTTKTEKKCGGQKLGEAKTKYETSWSIAPKRERRKVQTRAPK